MKREFALTTLILATPTPLAFAATSVPEINHVLNQCVTGKLCLFQKTFLSDMAVAIPAGRDGDWLRQALGQDATMVRLQLRFRSIKHVQGSEQGLEYEVTPMWAAVDGYGNPVPASDMTFFAKQTEDNMYTFVDCDSTSRCDPESRRAQVKFFTTQAGDAKVVFTSDLYTGMGAPSTRDASTYFKSGTMFTFEK